MGRHGSWGSELKFENELGPISGNLSGASA
jgi:hypothetical protein